MQLISLGRFSFFVGIILLLLACGSEEASTAKKMQDEPPLGPYGPATLGAQAHVVRSVAINTSGDVSGDFSGTKGEKGTYLSGLCDPTSFANFMIALTGGDQWDEIWITNYGAHVGLTETGTFKLSWVEVQFRKYAEGKFTIRKFKGPGTMTLTTHDADPDNRRMVGTMEGSGLEELTLTGERTGKRVDLQVSFDMDFSCGIKQ